MGFKDVRHCKDLKKRVKELKEMNRAILVDFENCRQQFKQKEEHLTDRIDDLEDAMSK
eukprot:CAMPEP_0116935688 /NCGR_PEP_ID=MMETSP0467-20121206/30438_1 /TAXON_ID=283647 /ORGANISM="Mesodinium pulex, Strain SPMC105" /LENGTH=57 /DNA_ID=CAMNT_0004617121 /DNA_START=154 /DNA_END=327 /DNA_ORIENTATION=-